MRGGGFEGERRKQKQVPHVSASIPVRSDGNPFFCKYHSMEEWFVFVCV